MRYVILRDDDTNALTPAAYLDHLYRPFLREGLPVNLATIPLVRTDVTRANGQPEGYLVAKNGQASLTLPITSNPGLVRYLQDHPCYHVVQHGYEHTTNEFEQARGLEISRRLEQGTQLLTEAGFPQPQTFVAPYDRFSSRALREAARRYRVVSSGWYEWRRVPPAWWPRYLVKKFRRAPHWQVGNSTLLSHPGCLLSYLRPYDSMLQRIQQTIQSRRLTVLVTHWWEYFPDNRPDEAFIAILHETARLLARQPDVRVVTFDDLARHLVPLS